jgi:hypothetical protein
MTSAGPLRLAGLGIQKPGSLRSCGGFAYRTLSA